MWVLRRIFIFKEQIFLTLVLCYRDLFFGIGSKVRAALSRVGGISYFIFGSVVHYEINESMSFFFSDINFYPLNLL